MLAVGGLLTFVAIFSIWINRQALNTDNWVNTSGKLLENKDVQSQLSNFLVTQLYANVDVQGELAGALPPKLAPLAGPAAGGLRQLAGQISLKALSNSQVQDLWAQANRAAHETLLKVLNGGSDAIGTHGGKVTLNLETLVAQIGSQLGVGADLSSKLPPDAGSFTVLDSDQLSTAQSVATGVRHLPVVLTLLAIALFAGAIYLARDRRRRTLRSVGFAFIVAGVLALIARSLAGGAVTDALATTESVRPAADAVWSIGTSLLVTVASSAIVFGLLVVIGAWLAGPTRPAIALRREASPYLREHRGAGYGVAAAIWLALLAWAPVAAFRKPLGILLFAVLFAVGAEILRRQILREFPDTRTGELGERMRSLGSAFAGRNAPVPAGADAGADAHLAQLERLGALHRDGTLSEEEFAREKATLLGGGGSSSS